MSASDILTALRGMKEMHDHIYMSEGGKHIGRKKSYCKSRRFGFVLKLSDLSSSLESATTSACISEGYFPNSALRHLFVKRAVMDRSNPTNPNPNPNPKTLTPTPTPTPSLSLSLSLTLNLNLTPRPHPHPYSHPHPHPHSHPLT
jgi:hypothetical protein